jgi:putative tryptophan/tyrosine transport system substrate-binding protein
VAWPLAAQAQPADRRPLVGYLIETTKEAQASRAAAFLEGMRDLGYVEGQNVEIAYRFGNFRPRTAASARGRAGATQPSFYIFAADPIAERVRRTLENVVAELKRRGRTAEQN